MHSEQPGFDVGRQSHARSSLGDEHPTHSTRPARSGARDIERWLPAVLCWWEGACPAHPAAAPPAHPSALRRLQHVACYKIQMHRFLLPHSSPVFCFLFLSALGDRAPDGKSLRALSFLETTCFLPLPPWGAQGEDSRDRAGTNSCPSRSLFSDSAPGPRRQSSPKALLQAGRLQGCLKHRLGVGTISLPSLKGICHQTLLCLCPAAPWGAVPEAAPQESPSPAEMFLMGLCGSGGLEGAIGWKSPSWDLMGHGHPNACSCTPSCCKALPCHTSLERGLYIPLVLPILCSQLLLF